MADAMFVALAEGLDEPLVTIDDALRRGAEAHSGAEVTGAPPGA